MDAIRKIEAALSAGPTETEWRPLVTRIDDARGYQICHFDLHGKSEKERDANRALVVACQPYAIREVLQTLASKEAEIARLREDLLALQMFTDSVIGEFPDHGDIDGFALQDIAVACGLLKEETVTAPCGEHCTCLVDGDAVGQCQCYRVQPVMHRARSAAAKHHALARPTEQP